MALIVRKWGNSLGILIPKQALKQANLVEGDELYLYTIESELYLNRNKDKESINHPTTIKKWGDSFGVRIPNSLSKELNINHGTRLSIKTTENNSGLVFAVMERTVVFAKDISLHDGTTLKAGADASEYVVVVSN